MASSSADGVLETLSNDLAGAVERAGRSVVAIHARRRIPASGVLWRPGVVVAANHTIHREDDITIALPDGTTTTATIAGRDQSTDLALLRLDGALSNDSVTVAERGSADELRVGALVLSLGRPGTSVTASLGVISSVGGEWRTWHGGRIDRLVRVDVGIYDGFSGGPLVSAGGRVLGINTSALSRGAAMTIPASTVDRVSDQLARDGRITRGYLGLGMMQGVRLPEPLAKELGSAGDVGLLVGSVESGGPADAAGVLFGDVIVAFDGAAVRDPSDLLALIGPGSVGQSKTLRVVRAGKVVDLSIIVGERPIGRRG